MQGDSLAATHSHATAVLVCYSQEAKHVHRKAIMTAIVKAPPASHTLLWKTRHSLTCALRKPLMRRCVTEASAND